MSIALRQSQMDIFDFILIFTYGRSLGAILRDGFYGRTGVWYYFPSNGSPPFPS